MRNTKLNPLKLLIGILAAALFVAPEIAMADTLGGVATRITQSLAGVTSLAGAIGYMVGFFFALGAIFKFKQHGDNPEQYPMRTPIFLVICAILSIYMTAVISTGKETIWGNSVQSQGVDGSGLQNGL